MGADKRERLKRKKDEICNSSHRLPAFVRGVVNQRRRVMGAQVKRLFAVVSVIASVGSGESDQSIPTLGIKSQLCKKQNQRIQLIK